LAAQGFRVFGTCHLPEPAPGDGFEVLHLDVTQEASVELCVRTVLERAGRLDVLVNNAGCGVIGPLEETSLEEARSLFEVNFFGVHRMVRAVLPIMRRQGGGRILNLSSAAALLGIPYEGLYCASKAALEAYSEALRVEVAGFGVQVALIEPGLIGTRFLSNAVWTAPRVPAYEGCRAHYTARFSHGWDRAAPPETVARLILRLLRRRRLPLRHPAGRDAALLARLTRGLPHSWLEYGVRRVFLPGAAPVEPARVSATHGRSEPVPPPT
jgi:NAD(P)-dependent dehydrogenase (short-subunit alcohol dehydrogenase family)